MAEKIGSNIILPASSHEKWTQQMHRDCGGEITIVVKSEGDLRFAACCKGCCSMWVFPQIDGWPDVWVAPDPAVAEVGFGQYQS